MLEELRHIISNVRFNLIDTIHTAAARKRSQRWSIDHAQLRQLMNTKTSRKKPLTFLLCENPKASSTGSFLLYKQNPKSHLHPLDTVKAVLTVKNGLLVKTIPTLGDLLKSLQQEDLSCLLLLQDQHQGPFSV